MEADVEELNRDPSSIASLDLDQFLAHYEKIIRDLGQPPIIIGHSLGGTMTQVLLDRGYGAAGVCVASATVKGVRDLPWSTIKSTFSPLNPLSLEESNQIYERYHAPPPPKYCETSPSQTCTATPPRLLTSAGRGARRSC